MTGNGRDTATGGGITHLGCVNILYHGMELLGGQEGN